MRERDRFVALAWAAIASCTTGAWAGETAQLLDGGVSVQLPDGFTRLSAEELTRKFVRSPRPPIAAFGDAPRTATIAFTLSDQNGAFTPEQLPTYVAAMEQILPKAVPGIVWHQKEIKSIGGRSWAHLRYASPTVERDIANDTWFTAFRGNILSVNLSAPAAEWSRLETSLVVTIEGLRLSDTPAVPGRAASK